MATTSRFHRFREAGEAANVNNVNAFGVPARSLFTSSKVLSLHHRIVITDDQENPVYRAQSKAISIRDKTDIYDANEQLVAHIERKIFTIRGRHYVTMADGTKFELSAELLHIVKDVINIQGLGWQLRGNILGLNFQLYDVNGSVIAVIAQKIISLHDKYCIDIYQPQYEKIVVTILITLQHMMRDRENARANSSVSSGD